MNKVTSEWVVKAESDFHSADALLHTLEVPEADTASFHCQQCAEKYLKAFLTENKIRFERTHILMDLLELCIPAGKDFRTIADDLNGLEGTQSRSVTRVQAHHWNLQRPLLTPPNAFANL